jgi:hypothetical protein
MNSVAVRLQGMTVRDQTLVLARLLEARTQERTFAPSEVTELFFEIGLPGPKRISDVFKSLSTQQLLAKGARGQWKLSPTGRARSLSAVTDIDLATLDAESASPDQSQLGNVPHAVVPPSLAPPALVQPLMQFLQDHPFETNVFGMTRFPESDDDDPVSRPLEAARAACSEHGLEFHLASDRAMHDDLWTNVTAHMWASHYGVGFFEDRRGRGLNYNLTIEVGGMIVTGRRCALLKDTSIERMPTDLVGMIYKDVDLSVPDSVSKALHRWLRQDLALGTCKECATS